MFAWPHSLCQVRHVMVDAGKTMREASHQSLIDRATCKPNMEYPLIVEHHFTRSGTLLGFLTKIRPVVMEQSITH